MRDMESRLIIGRRLKMLWGSLGFLFGVFLVLAATRQWRRNEDVMRDELVHSGNRTAVFETVPRMHQGKWAQGRECQQDDQGWRLGAKASERVEDTTAKSSAVDADATLRLFDEL